MRRTGGAWRVKKMRFRAALALLLVAGLYLGIAPRVHGGTPIFMPSELPGLEPDDFQFDPWDIPDIPDPPFPDPFEDPFDDIPLPPPPFDDPFDVFPPPDLPPLPSGDLPNSDYGPPGNGKVQRSLAMGAVPFATGRSTQPSTASYTIFVRQAGGTYLGLQRQSTPPYHLLSPPSEVLQSLAGGLKNLLNGPPGPAGTGLQSQGSATAADKSGPVVATAGANSVTVNLSANGKFTTRNYLIGPDVNSVFFADFNGDGSPDLAVAFDGSGAAVPGGIAILLNKGDGTFASPVIYGRESRLPSSGPMEPRLPTLWCTIRTTMAPWISPRHRWAERLPCCWGKGTARSARRHSTTWADPGRPSRLPTSTGTAFPTSRPAAQPVSCWAMAMELFVPGRRCLPSPAAV